MSLTKKKLPSSTLLSTLVLSVCILMFLEVLSSVAYYQKNHDAYLSRSSTVGAIQYLISKFDRTSPNPKLDRVLVLRKNGIKAYPSYLFEPQLHYPDGFYYLANAPNSHIVNCNEAGPFSEWKSDELGFRNPQGQLGTEVDFLFIGDSFTEGACEPEENTFAGVFRAKNQKVFNLGRGGSGPLFNLGTLVEYGTAVNAKTVIWIVFTGNDLRNLREEKTTKLSKYLNSDYRQGLLEKHLIVGRDLKLFLDNEVDMSKARVQRGLPLPRNVGYGESLDILEARSKERLLLMEVATRIKMTVASHGAKLAIVILNHPLYNAEVQNLTSETIKQFSEKNEIPYLEYSRSYLSKNVDSLYTPSIGHFSGAGYRAIGENIYERLFLDR